MKKNNQTGFATSLVILAAVFVLLAIVAVFMLTSRQPTVPTPIIPPVARPTTQIKVTAEPTLSSSDAVEDIEKDVEATEIEGVDAEVTEIEKELRGL